MSGARDAVAVTGAGGYLGRHVAAALRAAGHPVRALVRREGLPDWAGDPGIEAVPCDLAEGDVAAALGQARIVIHAAAGAGGDAVHARDTLAATDALLAALPEGARLVLVSSFSVYAVAAMPDGAVLDETSALDMDPVRRDAYARAKLAQELRATRHAQTHDLSLTIARPGAIWGAGRGWTARLGWRRGGRVLCPGGDAAVPAIHVADCAARLAALASAPPPPDLPSDVPILPGGGSVHAVNLVAPDPPRQADWIAALGLAPIRLPRGALMRAARLMDLGADVFPALDCRLPTGLREAVLAARFKPLRYDTSRAEAWLGPMEHRPFAPGGEVSA